MIKIKNKLAKRILGTITVGIGGWFVFEYIKGIIDPFVPLGLGQLMIGLVLVAIGIYYFGFVGGK